MSVHAGAKPIVTDKLAHCWDLLSTVSYPSGSENVYNHFSEAHVKKQFNGFGTNATGFTKTGFAAYGAETAHQRQKGYLNSDGSGDYLHYESNTNAGLPFKGGRTGGNYPSGYSMGGWFKIDSSNSSTRYLYGFGTSSSSYGYSYIRYNSTGMLAWLHEPATTAGSTLTLTATVEDDKWHYIMATEQGTSTSAGTRVLTVDGALHDTGTQNDSSMGSNSYIGGSASYTKYFTIGTYKSSSSTYNTSHLGLIGAFHVYAKALTVAEIQQNYYAGIDRFNW